MLRGSRPGERRGGRARGVPNRRSILTERILAIGSGHPNASRREFLAQLIRDPKLPVDTRMAVAPRCFPAKHRSSSRSGRAGRTIGKEPAASATTATVPIDDRAPDALDALPSIVQDASVDPKARRKAALKLAEFLLPKTPKKPKTTIDEYGFSVNPSLVIEYRDIRSKLRAFMKEKQRTRQTPAVAQHIASLEARCNAILRRCQAVSPGKYGLNEFDDDGKRLMEFAEMRGDGTALSEAEEIEEAYMRMRYRFFMASPQAIEWRRLQALKDDAERLTERTST
jgi:hypothetical protein